MASSKSFWMASGALFILFMVHLTFAQMSKKLACEKLCGTAKPNNGLGGRIFRRYEGKARTDQERKGHPIAEMAWDALSLPRYHDREGYTGLDGKEVLEEDGTYTKEESRPSYEKAFEIGPYLPFGKYG